MQKFPILLNRRSVDQLLPPPPNEKRVPQMGGELAQLPSGGARWGTVLSLFWWWRLKGQGQKLVGWRAGLESQPVGRQIQIVILVEGVAEAGSPQGVRGVGGLSGQPRV